MGRRFFFCCFTRVLPFYATMEPDRRLIKRCFKRGATGESTSSMGWGGGGGGLMDITDVITQDYERNYIML